MGRRESVSRGGGSEGRGRTGREWRERRRGAKGREGEKDGRKRKREG